MSNEARIIVLDRDADLQGRLSALASARELVLIPFATARTALQACATLGPDALIAASDPGGEDGVKVVSALRSTRAPTTGMPIVLLAPEGDHQARIDALRAGADACLAKPVDPEIVLAQVTALLRAIVRSRSQRRSTLRCSAPSAIAGDLGRMCIATVLVALELERRTGTLRLSAGGQRLELTLASGRLVCGRLNATPLAPAETVGHALRWKGRQFVFAPAPDAPAPPTAARIEQLLLAAGAKPDRASLVGLEEAFGPATEPVPPATGSSGTRARTAPAWAPGARLVETRAPPVRVDPRVEQPSPDDADDAPTTRRLFRMNR